MHSVTSSIQTPSHLPIVQPALTNEAVRTESQRYNCPIQRLKGGNPTTELPSGRLANRRRELNITFKPQRKRKQDGKLDDKLWQENG